LADVKSQELVGGLPVGTGKDRDMEVDGDGKDGSEDSGRKCPGFIMMAGASQKI